MYDNMKPISAVKDKISRHGPSLVIKYLPSSHLCVLVLCVISQYGLEVKRTDNSFAINVPHYFQHKHEAEALIKWMISMIDQTKKDLNMRSVGRKCPKQVFRTGIIRSYANTRHRDHSHLGTPATRGRTQREYGLESWVEGEARLPQQ